MMKSKRKRKTTTLLYCEGDTEEVCAEYLKSLWLKSIDIENWHWGSPLSIIQKAINNSEGYDKIFVWIDTDRLEIEEALMLAWNQNIEVICNSPDFETEILRILRPNIKVKNASKRKYTELYPNDSLLKERTYKRFSKKILWTISKDSPFNKLKDILL